ncbi:MAG: RNase adapter RapZ [Oscillospiraceae bacterium]|nr:RNase adapter RapZ [Oscillospiraceae bacterium]MCI7500244.1 RNase adapter RapZ [Oscillospiraceae bacterium]MDD7278779.1 RNase adapter RapZ [Oscillospiraceae bacterium]MDD7278836.1 RNase adapter RapZ [Oscillospiraceae bacterium]MDY2863632.1 RNase adapter RapZ [Oscillospiraceae bacterium]
MKFLIVTGLSGSGKSGAVNALEDIGYYCIDNIPPQLIPKFADICMQSNGQMDKVAIVTDIRGGDMFYQLDGGLEYLRHSGPDVKILFLDASDDVLIKRYKETRRRHPLDEQCHGSLLSAITKERSVLSGIREAADYYIDTSDMSMAQLRDTVTDLFMDNPDDRMAVKVMSFGFKYGMCREADIVLDVRCLPNPYYIPELKKHTGLESCVRDYVMSFEQSKELEKKLRDLIDFLLPLYRHEGKTSLVIAFGCTGGKHRSVTFAENMHTYLEEKGVRTRVTHRDIEVGKL